MQETQNLLDLIGVLIGFVAVMLLLSLVVTALVQATQATLRLRARNLKRGIEALLDNVLESNPKRDNKILSARILNAENLTVLGRRADPAGKMAKIKGPTVSYIDPKELPEAFKLAGISLTVDDIKKVETRFNRLWGQMDKRFLGIIRVITIAWAILVAFYFQVSAPALLRDLSVDPELRARYVAQTGELVETVGTALEELSGYQDLSEKALQRLEKRHLGLKEILEEASGIGADKVSLLKELETVLADQPVDRAAIIDDYDAILVELYKEQEEAAFRQARASIERLGRFNIVAWPHGTAFYIDGWVPQWKNLAGVLVTVVLLTFGAPFWFERLKEAASLKDLLSKGISLKKESNKDTSLFTI